MTGSRPAVDDVDPGGTQPVLLSRGRHPDPSRGTCLMEATAVLAGEPHSDRPTCVHPVLATLSRVVNDAVADEVRATLLPLSVRLIGTADASSGTTERLVALCCRRAQAVTPLIWALRLRRDLRRIDTGRTISPRHAVGTATYAAAMIALVSPPGRDHLLVDLLTDAIGLVAEEPAVRMPRPEATAEAGAGQAGQLSLSR